MGLSPSQLIVAFAALLLAAGRPAPGSDTPAQPPDPLVVPKGTPEELLKYIDELKEARPTSDSREVVQAFLKKQAAALLEAAERILAAKPSPEQAHAAVQYKLMALQILDRMGDPDAAKKIGGFAAELEKAGLTTLAREVRLAVLQIRARHAGLSHAQLLDLVAEVKRLLKADPIDRAAAGLALQTATAVEHGGDAELAVRAYAELGRIIAASDDPKVAPMAAMMQGAARRLGLVGKTFVLSGVTPAGKPFQWSKYKGKVVLVDFFATWCGPCRAELPNIARNYEAYHRHGFDVVSVSLDRDRSALDEFLDKEKHPWTVLLDNTEAAGTEKSMATYYGIFGIPQQILVGRDGKVVTLAARGERLGRELERLLGPPDEPPAEGGGPKAEGGGRKAEGGGGGEGGRRKAEGGKK
jgi:thiol-disulfide isomerase/thioredoxin